MDPEGIKPPATIRCRLCKSVAETDHVC
jgi:hypothetical protein